MKVAGVVLFILAGASCSTSTSSARRPIPQRVLFIGNSLTSENALPELVSELARAAGMPALTIGKHLGDNMNLADHWVNGAPALIDAGWDVVIMQQGPTSTAPGAVELRMMALRFAERIRASGGQPALHMVWPAAGEAASYPGVSKSYRAAAEDVDGYLFPVGEAWLEAWRRSVALPLYGADHFHPSAYGTYLAALTIFVGLYDRSAVGLPSRLSLNDGRGTRIWINPGDALILQASADEANRRFGRAP